MVSVDPVEVDTTPWVIRAGETTTLAWQVWINAAPIAAPWQARCQVRASVTDTTILETWTPVISPGGIVNIPLTAAQTTALVWSTAWIGVEVYNPLTTEVAYRIVQAPITVDPELVR